MTLLECRPGRRRPIGLLVLGMASYTIADIGYAHLSQTDSYQTGGLLDPLWIAAYLMLGLASLHPLASIDADDDQPSSFRSRRVKAFLPYAPIPVVLFVTAERVQSHNFDGALMWMAAVMVGLFAAQQVVGLRESLHDADALELRVQQRTAELRSREAHFRALLRGSSDAIITVDPLGIVGYASASGRPGDWDGAGVTARNVAVAGDRRA